MKMRRDNPASSFVVWICTHPVFIFCSPFFHCIQYRFHGLSQRSQGVFYSGRHFRIDSACDDTIGLQCTQAVCQNFLADAFQIFTQFVEAPRTHKKITQDQQFSFASDQLYGRCYRTCRHLFFCEHLITSVFIQSIP